MFRSLESVPEGNYFLPHTPRKGKNFRDLLQRTSKDKQNLVNAFCKSKVTLYVPLNLEFHCCFFEGFHVWSTAERTDPVSSYAR